MLRERRSEAAAAPFFPEIEVFSKKMIPRLRIDGADGNGL